MKITSKQRAFLRSLAHHLNPVSIVGKNGLTDSSLDFIIKALEAHELIKIKINFGDKNKIALEISKKTNSFIIGKIGKIIIFYKQSKNEDIKSIKLP